MSGKRHKKELWLDPRANVCAEWNDLYGTFAG